jgi:hypothetical protein
MLTTDRLAGAALSLLALGVLFECWRLRLPLGSLRNPGPAYLPAVLALLLLGLGTALIVLGRRAHRLGAAAWSGWRHAVAVLGACLFVALVLEHLGYRITMFVVLVFLLGVVERRGPVAIAAFALALVLGSYLVFGTMLRVPLPRGPYGL